MLPKKLRFSLRQNTDYFLTASRAFTPGFTVFYCPSEVFGAAILVSKKTAPLATQRSRMKRRFSEALNAVTQELAEKLPNSDCVFSLKASLANMSSEYIKQLITKAIVQITHHAPENTW